MLSPGYENDEVPAADWTPTPEFIATTNVGWLMKKTGLATYEELHAWSVQHRAEYWGTAIERLGVRFQQPYREVLDLSCGAEAPQWLPGARMNIAESCFSAPADAIAIVHQAEGGSVEKMTYGELRALTARVAANLRRLGYQPGDALAIFMPMTPEAVAIYLGIVAAGCAVVGIADSFAPREIATRLRIAKAVGVFTQNEKIRGGKSLPLYAQAIEAGAPRCIIIPAEGSPRRRQLSDPPSTREPRDPSAPLHSAQDGREGESGSLRLPLRAGDVTWADFLQNNAPLKFEPRNAADVTNILFSSGTTGEPKAIPWTQVTPLKCAVDAHFHVNVQPGDVVVWPTNLGWMMGPWLIFASLMNRATIGLYCGAPTGRAFGQFVAEAKATVLGLVPSLVRAWRTSGCMDRLDWSAIQVFSSTGECSRADDMRWLMQFAGGKPVIEYCGGTELGGAYISSTLARPIVAGAFNTPTLGLDVVILDEEGRPAELGELFVVPPSIGLSNSLLNKDHHVTYFAGAPRGTQGELLRRHGDQMERLPGGFWRAHGRADDTMNLGGIKVSSAEIEQTLRAVPGVTETAAIAVSDRGGGPSQLVIYAVCAGAPDHAQLATAMQSAIKRDLNPLFKIHDVIVIDALPRTASNKVMRRELRAIYTATHASQ